MVINTYNSRHNKEKPIKLNIDLMTLDIYCRYVLQNTNFVKMEHLINLRKLMYIIDPSVYENDPEKVKRVNFIIKGLEARLDNNINDMNLILVYINGGLQFNVDFLDYDHLELTKDEVLYVHKMVSESLQYQFLYDEVDNVLDLCTRFKTSDYMTRGNIVKEFEATVDNLKNQFRHSKIEDNITDMSFSLRDNEFESAVVNTWNLITNPSRRLITGMQGLNEMVGGGFESGRVYMLLGTSGVGKSITLLNLIYQMKRFNKFYKAKDPSKTPCICLLTMENTVVETITRLFDMVIEGSNGMGSYTAQECINKLRIEGELVVTDASPIDIVIKYKANKSINTSYLYTLYDDLEDDGYEMICLVQDHVKRIRSIYANSDLRLELGDIVNELKVFAAEKDIPVITNSHLNRDAARVLEEASRKSNQDAGKLLGKSNIGESMLMIDNLDCGLIITLDFDRDARKYMTFNLIKMRDKTTRTYIAQPFSLGSPIRLQEDYGGIPQFKESLYTAPELKQNTIVKLSGASAMTNSLDAVIDFSEDIDDNTFMNDTYSFDQDKTEVRKIVKPIVFMNTASTSFMNDLTNLGLQQSKSDRTVVQPLIFDMDALAS